MFYPLKFRPVFKDYIWGGRNLEKLGKLLPDGIVAESWEISCHPDGISIIENGEFAGLSLTDLIKNYGREIVGTALPQRDIKKFPLLVKIIDANDRLSVQVHPEDFYAQLHENGELGKNETWYIISAQPGANLVCGVAPGVNKEIFSNAVNSNKLESCLKHVEVFPGDTVNIPAGLIHSIGEGIVLVEIQQNSNTTYRIYDYNRTDKNGIKRPLHIEKACDVIDFNTDRCNEKVEGLELKINSSCSKVYKIANKYFSVELYNINGAAKENADGSRFHIYVFIEGEGEIIFKGGLCSIKSGDSILIPASMGTYELKGSFKALKSYVPNLIENIVNPLKSAGYSEDEIYSKVEGLRQSINAE